MREIEFRGKSTTSDKWVYGNLSAYTDKIARIRQTREHETDVIPCTVGQYIGKHDNSGKKIFEGDIIKSIVTIEQNDTDYSFEYIRCVVYNVESLCYGLCNVRDNIIHYDEFETFEGLYNLHGKPKTVKCNIIANVYSGEYSEYVDEVGEPHNLCNNYNPKRKVKKMKRIGETEMINLDEVIKLYEDKIEYDIMIIESAETMPHSSVDYRSLDEYRKRLAIHEQVVEWLKELKDLKDAPAADVQFVKQGHWIEKAEEYYNTDKDIVKSLARAIELLTEENKELRKEIDSLRAAPAMQFNPTSLGLPPVTDGECE